MRMQTSRALRRQEREQEHKTPGRLQRSYVAFVRTNLRETETKAEL